MPKAPRPSRASGGSEVKPGWTAARLAEVATVQSGSGFPQEHQGQVEGGIHFYKVSDMNLPGNEREMVHANNTVSEEVRALLGASLFPKGSTIFPKIGGAIATNKKRMTTQNCCVDNNVMGVIPKHGKVDPDFLFYRFLARDLAEFSNDSHLPSIKKTSVENWEIRLPLSISEQRRIVGVLNNVLERIAEARSNTERNLLNAREVFESRREDALARRSDWKLGPLGALCEIKHGFAFKGEFFTDSGEFVLLTPGNFFERGGYRDRGDKQKYYVGEVPPGYILSRGDMLVAMTEQAAGLLGSPLVVPESNKFLHNQRLGLVVPRPEKPWVTEFFFHVFNLARVRREIHKGGTGQKVRHTSPGRIAAVQVAYPESLKAQRAIAEQLAAVSETSARLEDLYEQKIATLDELNRSILHQAFSGTL